MQACDVEQLMRTLHLSQEPRFGLAVSFIHSRAENGKRDAFTTLIGGWGAPITRRKSTFAGVREPATLLGGRKPPSEGWESRSRAATPTFHGVVLSNDGSSIINIIMNLECSVARWSFVLYEHDHYNQWAGSCIWKVTKMKAYHHQCYLNMN